MLQRLVHHIESNQLFQVADRLLVAVSGGIDSVVLTDLLHHAGYNFAIAHCNFKLRGKDSDEDEHFVQDLALTYGKSFFTRSFETAGIASERGISIEMAARELRYAWFEEVSRVYHFDWIVVAHHRDDQIETFFLNLARGTGLSGLTGMKMVNGKVVRPLLFSARIDIDQYAADNRIACRQDQSNLSTDFQRNKIRHLILPLMEEIYPSFRESMDKSLGYLRGASDLIAACSAKAAEKVVKHISARAIEISIPDLKKLNPVAVYLYEMIKPYQFKGEIIAAMVKAMDGSSGKIFYSATHRAVVSRESLLIDEIKEKNFDQFWVEEDCLAVTEPISLRLSGVDKGALSGWDSSSQIAYIDRDKLQFPLLLRKWRSGDSFQPLGMSRKKKLSDFFIDQKISIPDKEKCWILTSGEAIVWIVGIRLDNRFKITNETRNVLVIQSL